MKRNDISIWNVIGTYHYLNHQVSYIECYTVQEKNYTLMPFEYLTRYFIICHCTDGYEHKRGFYNVATANQYFLYLKNDCGIELKREG